MAAAAAARLRQTLGLKTNKGLYDYEIREYARKFKITHFKGVYDRQNLPKKTSTFESFIVNLDDIENPGTHWVAIRKINNIVIYFDSYGDLPPPIEILRYFKNYDVYYNHKSFQNNNSVICGQLCIEFLINTSALNIL